MIINRYDGRLCLVTQSDHAHLSSQLLQLWRSDGLPTHPRRESILFAAAEHDNGWREADAAPRVNPETHRPHDFRSLPDNDRIAVWNRGILRYQQSRPEAALLIVEHALALFRARADMPLWQAPLVAWRTFRDTLIESLEAPSDQSTHDHWWLAVSDTLSLALAARWREPFQGPGYQAHVLDNADPVSTLAIAPFPLAGSTRFRLPCRWIDDRDYGSDLDLGVALASARWQERTVRLVPAMDPAPDL